MDVSIENIYDYDSVCGNLNTLMSKIGYKDIHIRNFRDNRLAASKLMREIREIINNTPHIIDHICIVGLNETFYNDVLYFSSFYFAMKDKLSEICSSEGLILHDYFVDNLCFASNENKITISDYNNNFFNIIMRQRVKKPEFLKLVNFDLVNTFKMRNVLETKNSIDALSTNINYSTHFLK